MLFVSLRQFDEASLLSIQIQLTLRDITCKVWVNHTVPILRSQSLSNQSPRCSHKIMRLILRSHGNMIIITQSGRSSIEEHYLKPK